jgi:cell surface protein SprA
MIKVPNLVPQDLLAWEMKLKNIYQLPKTNIPEQGFEFRILYHPPNIEYLPFFPNMSTYIITILGLDKYTNGRSGPPDNSFDFLPGYTIDQSNGWIIFPTLKPFLNNLQYFNPPIDSSYWYPQIYNQLKSNSNQAPNANNYLFTGYISR